MKDYLIKEYYDLDACEYAELYFDELQRKPFDQNLLQRFSTLVKDLGRVCDIGCGPGETTRFIKDRGVDVFGIDLSDGMVKEASKLNPDIVFEQGNMHFLRLKDASVAAIIAFYAIVNFNLAEVRLALQEFNRVIQKGGYLLLSFHAGNNEVIKVEKSIRNINTLIEYTFFNQDDVIRIKK